VPGGKQLCGWIAHPKTAPVDHRVEPTVGEKQVVGHQIAMQPRWRLVPDRCREIVLPSLNDGLRVEKALRLPDTLASHFVPDSERHAAPKVVRPWRWATRCIDRDQSAYEGGERPGHLDRVGQPLETRLLALQPTDDRPLRREFPAGRTAG